MDVHMSMDCNDWFMCSACRPQFGPKFPRELWAGCPQPSTRPEKVNTKYEFCCNKHLCVNYAVSPWYNSFLKNDNMMTGGTQTVPSL